MISVDVPESLIWQTGKSEQQVKAHAQFLLALKMFELGEITSGQAAEISKTSRVEFLSRASKHGIPVADLDEIELAKEIARP